MGVDHPKRKRKNNKISSSSMYINLLDHILMQHSCVGVTKSCRVSGLGCEPSSEMQPYCRNFYTHTQLHRTCPADVEVTSPCLINSSAIFPTPTSELSLSSTAQATSKKESNTTIELFIGKFWHGWEEYLKFEILW